MRILIPTVLSTKRKVGVTQYLVKLIESLQEIDDENEYFIITTFDNHGFFNLSKKNFHELKINIRELSRVHLRILYLFWHYYSLPKLVKLYKIDIIHMPCAWFTSKKINTVVTIHDLIEIKTPKYNQIFNFIKTRMIYSSIKNAKHIISVSKSTARDINLTRNSGITVIHNGNDKLKNLKQSPEILSKYNLDKHRYFVFVGTLQKHKNLDKAILSFNKLVTFHNNYKLVLIGQKDNSYSILIELIKKLNLNKEIIMTGHLPDSEKDNLVMYSRCLILISKYEGFGLPILEAQSMGVPVICSNRSSLPEIAGDGALLANPDDINDIFLNMKSVIENNELKNKLVELGLKNIERFSWQKCAEETLEVYKMALIH